MESAPITKRLVLRRIASVFDVLGLFSPITIRGRVLFQQLWVLGLEWDDPLPPEQQQLWLLIQQDLLNLHEVKIQRRVTISLTDPIYLLCFTDASTIAYAAVIYLQQGDSTVLLMSKARVSPLKPVLTVPRLELTAVVIGTRLLAYVQQHLQVKVEECHLWSDSQIALLQIAGQKSTDAWVRRRVQEIQAFEGLQLHHCPGSENPADLATRTGTTLEKIHSTHWFSGPNWLQDKAKWADSSVNFGTAEVLNIPSETTLEATTLPALVSNVKESQHTTPFGIDVKAFSQLQKLLRVTVYCRRFVNLTRKRTQQQTHITAIELEQARLEWVRSVQAEHFKDEIESLRAQKPNQRCRQLDLFLDQDGTLRVSSRLANAPIQISAKYPALLPKQDPFTLLFWSCKKLMPLFFTSKDAQLLPKSENSIGSLMVKL